MDLVLIEKIRGLIVMCNFLSEIEKDNYSRLLTSLTDEQLREIEDFLSSELEVYNTLMKKEEDEMALRMKLIKKDLSDEFYQKQKLFNNSDTV